MSSKRARKSGGKARTKSRAAPARTSNAKASTGYVAALAATPYVKQANELERKPTKQSGRKGAASRKGKPAYGTAAAYRQCAATARDTSKRPAQRISALRDMTPGMLDDARQFASVLDILKNPNEPTVVRLAALRSLEAASFAVNRFDAYRNDYVQALRSITNDKDEEVRTRVLGALARMSDRPAQELLLTGLKEPAKALVPPEKALQLLSYDVHADAYAAARDIAAKPPTKAARRAALRLLAADATSAPVFTKILKDKSETAAIRQLSATALHAIAPDQLQEQARQILLDAKEDDQVKAVSLTALTDLRRADQGDVDDRLYQHVNRMHGRSDSALVKRSAKRFLKKYKR